MNRRTPMTFKHTFAAFLIAASGIAFGADAPAKKDAPTEPPGQGTK